MNYSKKSTYRASAAGAVLLSLAACGGGGSSYSTPAPAPTLVVNTLSGTAAVGSPIVGGTVKIICSAGSANATVLTTSTGAWQASVTDQTLPCAVQVSGGTIRGNPNTTPYHALTLGFGVVNLTPLTDLLVANQAASATPATWFTALGTSTAPLQSFTQAQADADLTKLRAALGALAPLDTVNPVTTPFTAAPGNTSDDILSSLQIALTNLSMSYTSLLGNAAVSAFTPPTGLGAAIGTAYLTTPSGTPAVAIAPAPTNVQVTVTSQSQLNLTWAAATGATTYNVYRSTAPSVQVVVGNKIASPTTATSLQDTGLTASTAYYYKVTAVNSAGESVGSAEVTGTTQAPAAVVPLAPTGLSANAASASQINLAWTAVSGTTGYNVYRATAANVAITAGNKLTTTATTATSYNDSAGLSAATAYFYKVTAVNAAGESASGSNEVTATTASTTVTGASKGILGEALATVFSGEYVFSCRPNTDFLGTTTPVSYSFTVNTNGTTVLNGQPWIDATHAGKIELGYLDASSASGFTGPTLTLTKSTSDYNAILLFWKADGSFMQANISVAGKDTYACRGTGQTVPAASAGSASSTFNGVYLKKLARTDALSNCPVGGPQTLTLGTDGSAQVGSQSFTSRQVFTATDNSFDIRTGVPYAALSYSTPATTQPIYNLLLTFDSSYKVTALAAATAKGTVACQ